MLDNDSQIIRLLVYKKLKTDVENYDTDSVIISFREYDPDEEMILCST